MISENNSSHTLIQGMRGPPGLPGAQGKEGPAAPKSGEATYIRWGKSSLRVEEFSSSVSYILEVLIE